MKRTVSVYFSAVSITEAGESTLFFFLVILNQEIGFVSLGPFSVLSPEEFPAPNISSSDSFLCQLAQWLS